MDLTVVLWALCVLLVFLAGGMNFAMIQKPHPDTFALVTFFWSLGAVVVYVWSPLPDPAPWGVLLGFMVGAGVFSQLGVILGKRADQFFREFMTFPEDR